MINFKHQIFTVLYKEEEKMFEKNASPRFKARAFIILIIGFITMYCSGMFGTDIINVIQNPITEKIGCSATQAVLGWTIGGYTVIFIAFIFSTIIMKKGVREFATVSFFIMACGAILVGVGYNMNSVVMITVGGFLLKNFLQALQLCVFQLVARWFVKTRGFVLGFIGAAFALDNSTSSTGLTFLYSNFGFTGMMIVAAAIMMLMGVFTFAFIRTTPEEIGLTVDGIGEDDIVRKNNERVSDDTETKWSFGRLLKIKESWCIMIGIGVFNMTLTAVISQFFNSLMGMGVEISSCMTYMLIFGLLGIVMSPIYGKMVDTVGAPKTGVITAFLYCVSIAGFCFKIPILAALGLTFFVGAPVLQPALTMHVFGGREYQAVNRYLAIVVNLIAACGIPFMTIFSDLTGSYTTAYFTLLIMNIIVLLLMIICKKTYVEE